MFDGHSAEGRIKYESYKSHEESLPTPDSEFDDALGVPDSLEIKINENGDAVGILNQDYREIHPYPDGSPRAISFARIHARAVKFKSHSRDIFIPDEEIQVRIVDNERSVTTHPMNPNLYTIEFKHGPFIWNVKKRYKHIQNLHNQLKIYRTTLNVPFPTKSHREHRNSLKNLDDDKVKRRNKGALPRFPNKPDGLVSYEHLPHRMRLLEDYLTNLLNVEIYKRHPETIYFMELSHLSFIEDLGGKGKEGLVLKRTGSSAKAGCNFCGLLKVISCFRCNYFCTSLCGSWQTRHLVVKDTFVAYISPKDGIIKTVILMDNGFEVSSGMYSTGLRNGLQIMNLSRHIVLKCWTRRKAKEWLESIQNIANNEGAGFIRENPHKSFAPYRFHTPATWYVDGCDYMAAVADALEKASQEIFIADWWLSPEIYLKRPVIHGDYWRLDKILQRKALEGVKVFIMIYKEVELALGINSYYSKQKLVSGCPENIKILRHPDHARVGVLLWAHHEKMVVVDQSIAFLGGIDLCYGRWDNNEHRLTDLGSAHHSSIYIPSREKITTSSTKRTTEFRADKPVLRQLAVATNTIALATTKFLPIPPLLDLKSTVPSLPKLLSVTPLQNSLPPEPEETIKCDTPELQRKNLFDMAKNTVDKVKYNVRMKRRELINMVYNPNEVEVEEDEDEVDHMSVRISQHSQDLQNLRISEYSSGGAKLWLGKDYTNFIVKDFDNLERPYQDSVDRSTTPRMPWHDVGVMVQHFTARDVARHFIQRWNAIKVYNQTVQGGPITISSLDIFETIRFTEMFAEMKLHSTKGAIAMEKAKLNSTYPFLLPKSYRETSTASSTDRSANHRVRCQVLRSVSSWSAGFLEPDTVEQSIHEAYIDAISKAKRFIYIENQFFITLATMDRGLVKNRIGETLLKRIIRAHREGSVFRVFVVMPLLPGFEGEIGGPSGTALHAITHWNYSSISRGRDAILNRLRESGIKDPSEYITFHGLRTYSLLNGTMVTELIYVHSKLMIVDDNTVICGSANINDRSMIATRDSEIAVIIHDEEYNESTYNGTTFQCGKFASSLRKQLFREHLGLLHSSESMELDHITDKSFYNDVWRARSERNTEIFEEVFRCIPSDKVMNFATLESYQSEIPLCQSDPDLARQRLADVNGHLVDLPLNFLCQEILTPAAGTVEGMLPTSLWT